MMIIGITGSFGSGKTTIAKMFKRKGAYVIDADKVCHSLMSSSADLRRKIVRRFGKDILTKDGKIDRKKLGRFVFKDKAKLRMLNRLIHPAALKEIKRIIKTKRRKDIIMVDAPLLIESDFYKEMDRVIVVSNTVDKQIKRLVKAGSAERKDALRRIRMQSSLKRKLELADFIIDNSGSKKKTLFQVGKIWKTIGS